MRALLLFLTAVLASGAGVAAAAVPCEEAAASAEQAHKLPPGLLSAIGRVESGRWVAGLGRTAAWPWSIDVAGDGQHFESAADAIQATRTARARGVRNIDVGCFQVSLLHHPNAFKDLETAFDPVANADYAGGFLASLKERTGSWDRAVAAYHSADPARGEPYRRLVFAAWNGTPPQPDTITVSQPQIAAFGIRIWTPGPRGSAPGLVAMVPPPTNTVAMVESAPPPAWKLPKVTYQR